MTKTSYTTESHRYTENTPCDAPKTCTKRAHWQGNDDEYDTLAEVRAAVELDDAPAIRIILETRTVTRTAVEVR